jgi:hypothetical protein
MTRVQIASTAVCIPASAMSLVAALYGPDQLYLGGLAVVLACALAAAVSEARR